MTGPKGPSNKCTAPYTRWYGRKGLVQGATLSSPGGCSKLLKGMEGPAHRVMGSPGREILAEFQNMDFSKVQEVAVGMITSVGMQQGMVP